MFGPSFTIGKEITIRAAYVSQRIARMIDLGARWLGGWGSVQAEGLVSPLKPGKRKV
jgi:hypothetical protein